MKICVGNQITLGRRLKKSEIADYSEVLQAGLEKCAEKNGKNILIVPASSLPQSTVNNTGVGNLGSEESLKFFDFAKIYWGINEVQILPMGQYFKHGEHYPVYSGTSMSLGNHVINAKEFLKEEDLKKIVNSNGIDDRVNFQNVVEKNSVYEEMLKKLHNEMNPEMMKEFEEYKKNNADRLEPKAIFEMLKNEYGTSDYNNWNNTDKNLYDDRHINKKQRDVRIKQVYDKYSKEIDFYKFKQYLAEKSLAIAKNKLNARGLRLDGDLPCGYTYDEVWAHPKAFLQNKTIGWSFPAMDMDSPEAEKLFREKVNLYSKWYDGFRVDASWSYVSPTIKDKGTGRITKKDYGDKFLKIIDEEYIKVKGANADLKNLLHEFVADFNDFSIYEGGKLKPYVESRMKYYTSDALSDEWGSAGAFRKMGWNSDSLVLGAVNHDSEIMTPSENQVSVLADIFKKNKTELANEKEFIKAKFADPLAAKHKFIFFMPALGVNQKYKGIPEEKMNYTYKIPQNYEDFYQNALQNDEGYNPMDALEKNFKAKGYDKTHKNLYKKIVKYRDILKKTEKIKNNYAKYFVYTATVVIGLLLAAAGLKYFDKEKGNYTQCYRKGV